MQSIRWRLVLTYFIIIVLTLALISVYITNAIRKYTIEQEKVQALTQANVIAGYISQYQDRSSQNLDYLLKSQTTSGESRILMLDKEAKIIYDSNSGILQDKLMPSEAVLEAINGKDNAEQITDLNDDLVVGAAAPILENNKVTGVIYYQASAADAADFMDTIFATMVMLIILVSVLIGVISFFMAGIITDPIRSLTEKLRKATDEKKDYYIEKKTGGEIGQLIDSFNKMTEQIQIQEEKRQEFVSNASHELKTPLSSIKLISDSLLNTQDAPPEMVNEFLADMNVQVDRLSRIVDKLLTLTRMDNSANVSRMEFAVTDITELCSNITKALRPLAEQKSIELTYNAETTIYSRIERDRLWEAIYNVLDNSIKYTKEDGKVSLNLTKDENHVIIEISDTGIGLAPDEKYKIFDRFYRVDKARARETGGTGLGLSIALTAVELHGGEIVVESEEGVGSTFRIIIPITFK